MGREKCSTKYKLTSQIGYTIRKCARVTRNRQKDSPKVLEYERRRIFKISAASRERTKILDPYRGEIISELETYPDITSAIIYDHL